jgi:uncharacterized DUF497 family protein
MPDIEFDPGKDAGNRAKHGIALSRAADFDWGTAVIRPDVRSSYGESRFIAIGLLEGRVHVLVYTPREDRVRVIGLRTANAREVRIHGQAKEAGSH